MQPRHTQSGNLLSGEIPTRRTPSRQPPTCRPIGRSRGRGLGLPAAPGARGGFEPLEQRLLFSAYTVTSLADDSSGSTLRDAVDQADADGTTDVINFAPGLSGTITLTQGYLDLSGTDITLDGAGAISISGGGMGSILRVENGTSATVSNLTLTGGSAFLGGAIDNTGTLSIDHCVLSGNTAAGALGGAIFNSGTLSVLDTTLSGNSSTFGGAVYASSGSLTISGCTFTANTATGGGNGGALYDNFDDLTITNSTFAGNSTDGEGGAIYVTNGNVTLTNDTIATNTAAIDGGGVHVEPGFANVSLYNTIVAGNLLSDGVTPSDITGTLDQSLGSMQAASSFNLIGAGGAGGLADGAAGNHVNVASAGLGALANNGGPTQTMALLAGSPAIDAGSNALAMDAGGNALTTDQRDTGFARVNNGTVDIGAFESAPPVVVVTVVTPTLNVAAVTGTVDHSVTLSASLLDATNMGIAGEKMTFMLDGKVVGKAKTDASGMATLNVCLKGLTPGMYAGAISVSFAGDAKYNAVSGSAALTVNDAPIHGHHLHLFQCNNTVSALDAFSQDRLGAVAKDFTATIDWGDGSKPAGLKVTAVPFSRKWFALVAEHTYATPKVTTTYMVTVIITSKYGATETVTKAVTIEAPKPAKTVSKSCDSHH